MQNLTSEQQTIFVKLGILLKEIRLSEGKRQSDYSDYGISRSLIQRVEAGQNITLKNFLSLLETYGYNLHDLTLD